MPSFWIAFKPFLQLALKQLIMTQEQGVQLCLGVTVKGQGRESLVTPGQF